MPQQIRVRPFEQDAGDGGTERQTRLPHQEKDRHIKGGAPRHGFSGMQSANRMQGAAADGRQHNRDEHQPVIPGCRSEYDREREQADVKSQAERAEQTAAGAIGADAEVGLRYGAEQLRHGNRQSDLDIAHGHDAGGEEGQEHRRH